MKTANKLTSPALNSLKAINDNDHYFVFDGGLQDYKVHRSFVCFNSLVGLGLDTLFPKNGRKVFPEFPLKSSKIFSKLSKIVKKISKILELF